MLVMGGDPTGCIQRRGFTAWLGDWSGIMSMGVILIGRICNQDLGIRASGRGGAGTARQ